ncbi:MAG: glycoside hydrolase family 88 protein [Lachnospiraceae bacterium]|nr:glycoside hydrolase family 88 protein [Lachnospiraceae bacterium]
MIGNNLKKDIAGANRFGITSIWLDWSPRYFHTVEEPDWQPDYTVKTPEELKERIDWLERELEEKVIIEEKCQTLLRAFPEILSEPDEKFLQNMQTHNLGGDDLSRYRYWEWPQGVGLYGIWKDFLYHGTAGSLELLTKYYDRQMEMGFPSLNVNTAAPYLAMSYLAEHTGSSRYMEACKAAVTEIMTSFPRTEEGGFQHKTSDCVNEQELWDDTLFMLVLFVANMGRILKDETLSEEAERQFLLHAKYLSDPETGLWYHGWTFKERNHFAGAFWGRGNCWVTMGIPEFLAMGTCSETGRKQLSLVLQRQVESLRRFQDEGGMWHTLIDDPDSYLEASATCGITYGILRAVKEALVDSSYLEVVRKALPAILNCIMEDGVVSQVSYGTPMGRQDKDFYKTIPIKPMPYGQALALLVLEECACAFAETYKI